MPTAPKEGKGVEISVDLGVLQDDADPAVQAAVAQLVGVLQGGTHAHNGFGNRFSLVLTPQSGEKDRVSQEGAPARMSERHDSSPTAWFDGQDQMSRPTGGRQPNTWE